LKREQADLNATPEQKALNAQREALTVQKAQRQARQELQAIVNQDVEKLKTQTAELVKQRDLLREQNDERKKAAGFQIDSSFGGLSGVEGINTFGGGFEQVGGKPQATTEDGRTEADLDREIRRNQARIEQQKQQSPQNSTSTSGSNNPPNQRAMQSAETSAPNASQFQEGTGFDLTQVIGLLQNISGKLSQLLSENSKSSRALSSLASRDKQPPENYGARFVRGRGNTLI